MESDQAHLFVPHFAVHMEPRGYPETGFLKRFAGGAARDDPPCCFDDDRAGRKDERKLSLARMILAVEKLVAEREFIGDAIESDFVADEAPVLIDEWADECVGHVAGSVDVQQG